MLLAQLICERPDELRADLMETYGIDLDEAMEGAHSAPFVASLAMQLPQDCRWRVSYDGDMWWTGDRMLLAALANALNGLIWGLSDKRKRGMPPRQVGPSWATDRGRKAPAMAMDRDRLVELLSRPRDGMREREVGDDGR